MDADDALALGQMLWNQIEMRLHSSGTDNVLEPHGVWGAIDYYKGKHKLRFASAKFEEHFRRQFSGFTDNWCAPVIDATAERLNPLGIRLGPTSREADAEFQRVFDANDAQRGISEAFTVALAASRSYGLVWGNPDDEQTPRITFEHPAYCALARDPETGRTTAAAKGWTDDECGYLTLYTDDEVWKWKWSIPKIFDPRRPIDWQPRQPKSDDTWPIPNPIGRVPMFEFRNQTLLDDRPLSDLGGVAAMQDAVNLIWAYMFNAMDFVSLPQRVVTGIEPPSMPVLDADGKIVGSKPVDIKKYLQERIMFFGKEGASIDSWPAASITPFVDVIGLAVDHISAQTRTPPHYLVGKMANMSSDALTVAETGLVAKTVQRQANFTHPQREMYQLIALAQGKPGRAKAAASGKIVWADPQYRALSQKTDAFQKLASAGLPLRYRLEWWGLDAAEVERVMQMTKDEPAVIETSAPLHPAPGTVMPRGQNIVEKPNTTGAATAPAETPTPPATGADGSTK